MIPAGPDAVAVLAARKVEWEGTHRTRALDATWALIEPRLRDFGITRIADVTGLDRLGIPVWMAYRPCGKTLSVSQGKGLSARAAQCSAVMESIELWYAENAVLPAFEATAIELNLPYDATLIARSPSSMWSEYAKALWCRASILGSHDDTFLPISSVLLEVETTNVWEPLTQLGNSNGLAAGNSVAEASVHALYELIERHCVVGYSRRARSAEEIIDLSSIRPRALRSLLDQIASGGGRLEVDDISLPWTPPAYFSYLWVDDQTPIFAGSGCHSDPSVAMARAITEAAQSRLTHISGARDDLAADSYSVRSRRPHREAQVGEQAFQGVSYAREDMNDELAVLVESVTSQTGQPILRVVLTPDEQPFAVVHLVSPGLAWESHETLRRRSVLAP